METEIIKIDPGKIKLLEINARYLEKDEYKKLVNNIKKDKKLTSVPFCYKTNNDEIEVLSGNHRVMAAIDAGLKEIEVMLCKEKLTKEQRTAIQLSHNSIIGQDDKAILKQLYESIDSLDFKKYSGLADDFFAQFDKLDTAFHIPVLDYQIISLLFLPSEIDSLIGIFKQASAAIDSNKYIVANLDDYDNYNAISTDISKAICVKNPATVFLALMELAKKHIEELKKIWIEKAKPTDYVPISTIIGRSDIKKQDAMVFDRAVETMLSRGEILKKKKEDALVVLSNLYLGKNS